MPVVANTERDPAGNPHRNVPVRVRLVAALVGVAPGYVPAEDYSIIGSWATRTDNDGAWSVDLVSNELIAPADTFYQADVSPKIGPAIRHEFAVPNGVGPYRVEDILTDPPANLPTTLSDLLEAEIGARTAADTAEAAARAAEDIALGSAIASEVADRTAAVAAEAAARVADVNAEEFRALAAESAEALARAAADTALGTNISAETAARIAADDALGDALADSDANLAAETAARVADINAEEARALAAEAVVAADITAEAARAAAAESVLAGDIAGLDADLGTIDTALATEMASRAAADSTLTTNLAAETATRIADVNAEENRALVAESALAGDITAEVSRALAAEALRIPLTQKGAAGGVATLDGGTKVPVAQIPDLSADYVPAVGFTELAQDVVGGMVTGNTETNIAVTYDDATGKLNFAVDAGMVVSAPPTGVAATDTASLVAFLEEMNDNPGCCGLLRPGVWSIIPDNAVFPTAIAPGQETVYNIFGFGAYLNATNVAGEIIGDDVADLATATSLRTLRSIHLWGIVFNGTQLAGQIGFRLIGAYGPSANFCRFNNLDIGRQYVFVLDGSERQCLSRGNLSFAREVRSATGILTGATGSNSGSNCFECWGSRDYAKAGQLVQYRYFEADGWVAHNIITEGANPVDAIVQDGNGNTTVKTATIDGWHNEHAPSGAGLRIKNMVGGTVRVARPFWQVAQTLIDSTENNQAAVLVHVEDIPYIPASPFLAPGGNGWFFSGTTGGQNMRSTGVWVGGTVPGNAYQFTYDGANGPVIRAGSMVMSLDAAFAALSVLTNHGSGYAHIGRLALGAPDTLAGFNPVVLPVSTVLPYLDQANGTLVWKVTESGGTQYDIAADYKSPAVLSASRVAANTRTASYVLVAADAGKVVEMNVGSANTLTVPPNSSVAFPIGTVIEAYQMGAGQTTLTAGVGVTLTQREGKLKLAGQGASASLRKRGTDEWVVSGDVAA